MDNLKKTLVSLSLRNPFGAPTEQGLYGKFGMGRAFKVDAYPYPVPADFPITPSHIVLQPGRIEGSIGKFGWTETEQVAYDLWQLALKRGHWGAFTLKEYKEFYPSPASSTIRVFDGLGYLLYSDPDGPYQFSIGFVLECWMDTKFLRQKEPYPYAAGSGEYILKEAIAPN